MVQIIRVKVKGINDNKVAYIQLLDPFYKDLLLTYNRRDAAVYINDPELAEHDSHMLNQMILRTSKDAEPTRLEAEVLTVHTLNDFT